MLHAQDSFKKQTKILYYAKMRQVAQALFERGSKDSSIARGLLVPVALVKEWRKLYQEGALVNQSANATSLENNYSHHDLKHIANVFFEMGFPCRPISLYLGVPVSTVYYWHDLFKQNQLDSEPSTPLTPYVFTGEKYISFNNRRRYSFEARQVAKDCFLKGMSLHQIAAYMDVDRMTVSKWKRAFEQGRFYVNKQEQLLYTHACQTSTFDPSQIDKKAVKELLELGLTDKQIATTINVPLKTIQSWMNLEKQGELKTDFGLTSKTDSVEPVKAAPKTANGRYTTEVRQAAQECFEKGFGYKFTAKQLGISPAITRDWCRLFKEGRFKAEK